MLSRCQEPRLDTDTGVRLIVNVVVGSEKKKSEGFQLFGSVPEIQGVWWHSVGQPGFLLSMLPVGFYLHVIEGELNNHFWFLLFFFKRRVQGTFASQ